MQSGGIQLRPLPQSSRRGRSLRMGPSRSQRLELGAGNFNVRQFLTSSNVNKRNVATQGPLEGNRLRPSRPRVMAHTTVKGAPPSAAHPLSAEAPRARRAAAQKARHMVRGSAAKLRCRGMAPELGRRPPVGGAACRVQGFPGSTRGPSVSEVLAGFNRGTRCACWLSTNWRGRESVAFQQETREMGRWW